MLVSIKRVYEEASEKDGYRVLVDRLWPRGIRKENARVDLWLKEVAPTTELRKWFNHEPARFEEFCARYESELKDSPALLKLKSIQSNHPVVTLLYGARDQEINHTQVLLNILERD